MTNDETILVTSPVTSDNLQEYLDRVRAGTAKTVVTSEGAGWSFNCDGTAHYLQKNDVTRREPNGRFKREYQGKIENDGTVTYKKQTRYESLPCPNQYERWAKVRHVKVCKRDGEDAGRPINAERRDEYLPIEDRWKDGGTAYIQ